MASPLRPSDRVHQQSDLRCHIARGLSPDSGQIGPVHGEDVGETEKILACYLACGLAANLDAPGAGDGNRARIRRVADVVGCSSCRFDVAFKPVARRCRAECALGHWRPADIAQDTRTAPTIENPLPRNAVGYYVFAAKVQSRMFHMKQRRNKRLDGTWKGPRQGRSGGLDGSWNGQRGRCR